MEATGKDAQRVVRPAGGAAAAVDRALEEFAAWKLSQPLSRQMKSIANSAVGRLRAALNELEASLPEVVEKDMLAGAIEELSRTHCAFTVQQTRNVWREAFRWLCRNRFIALSYERCVLPADGRDPYDPDVEMDGFPEALHGIYPRSIVPVRAASVILRNERVPEGVRKEFYLAVANMPECKTHKTRETHWQSVRKLALDLELNSLSELASPEGARRLLGHFQHLGYNGSCSPIKRFRAIFNALGTAELMVNPFSLKEKTAIGSRWIIDYEKLQKQRTLRGFRVIRGRRHKVIAGREVECRLPNSGLEKIASFGNPALRDWRARRKEELQATFKEAQENQIARIALHCPPRPTEMRAMNQGGWSPVAEDPSEQMFELRNNARPNRLKHRPDWIVHRSCIEELEELWNLRRAYFSSRGDIDNRESTDDTMNGAGIAMWVNPFDGTRMRNVYLNGALRSALRRMGVDADLAGNATMYWLRKAHQAYARSHSGGVGDKFIAENAGHSEETMRGRYDGPEQLARAEHLRKNLWAPLGVVKDTAPPAGARQQLTGSSAVGTAMGAAELESLAKALVHRDGGNSLENTLVSQDQVRNAARQAGLLMDFRSAAVALDLDVRSVERWCASGHLRPVRDQGERLLWKADVAALAGCLTPDEAAKHLPYSSRHIRNLVHSGQIPGAISVGKNIRIPLTSLREFEARRRKGGRAELPNRRPKTSATDASKELFAESTGNSREVSHTAL